MTADRVLSDHGPEAYERILRDYLVEPSEEALYRVSLLSQQLIEAGMGPEDIIALHFESLDRVTGEQSYRNRTRAGAQAQQFLLEVMIAYGVRFREYLELKLREALQDAASEAAHERQRALDAERVGRQRDEMLAVIAHEMRTPLAAARGNLDLAKRSLTRQDVERVTGLLERAREAVDRLSRLTADLVEASREEEPTLTMAPLDLVPVVEQACAWVEATALAKEIEVTLPQTSEPLIVHADADGMLSVLGNLLSNAVRYTPKGGRVTVGYGADDRWVWLTVRDTGIGMTPEVQARIFERFYRAPGARQLEARGLGLGLTLVQKLVLAHGGRIEIESEDGRGSRFTVYLPLDAAREQTGPAGPA